MNPALEGLFEKDSLTGGARFAFLRLVFRTWRRGDRATGILEEPWPSNRHPHLLLSLILQCSREEAAELLAVGPVEPLNPQQGVAAIAVRPWGVWRDLVSQGPAPTWRTTDPGSAGKSRLEKFEMLRANARNRKRKSRERLRLLASGLPAPPAGKRPGTPRNAFAPQVATIPPADVPNGHLSETDGGVAASQASARRVVRARLEEVLLLHPAGTALGIDHTLVALSLEQATDPQTSLLQVTCAAWKGLDMCAARSVRGMVAQRVVVGFLSRASEVDEGIAHELPEALRPKAPPRAPEPPPDHETATAGLRERFARMAAEKAERARKAWAEPPTDDDLRRMLEPEENTQ